MALEPVPESGTLRTAIITAVVGFSVLAAVTMTGSRPPRDFTPGGPLLLEPVVAGAAGPAVGSLLTGAIDLALGQSPTIQPVHAIRGPYRFRLTVVAASTTAPYRLVGVIHDSLGPAQDTLAVEGDAWLEAADHLGLLVRRWFGERRTERDRADVPVARLGSPSPGAMAAYGEALTLRAQAADSAAMEAARRAVALDSAFGQAWQLAGLSALALRRPEGEAWVVRGRELLARGPRRP